MSKRPKIGDIVEIPLSTSRLGYAQYTHKHKKYGELLRVFRQTDQISEMQEFEKAEHLFTTFFPLGSALNRGIVSIVGNLPIRAEFKNFPVFRAGLPNQQGKVEVWWLWNGESEEKIGVLSDEQMKYPIRGIINDTLLIERICDGWQG